jgi:putative oxygen-independent coproporphyrinogen III oxidase
MQKLYPDREMYGTVWYPPSFVNLNNTEIWNKKEIGFYLHIPFCTKICKYCPFNKYAYSEDKVCKYVDALLKEIELISKIPYFKNTRVIAGYYGGGTPTSLKLEQLTKIINATKDSFDISPDAEISIEANPDTVKKDVLDELRSMGVNRISFGVQSFNNEKLHLLGRDHKAEDAYRAIEMAQKAGFDNVGIDLLYNVPGQTLEDWQWELNQAVGTKVDHISTLSLFIDPGTGLFNARKEGKIPEQPAGEIDIEMYNLAIKELTGSGYNLYTMYDFALPGKECVHHSINWEAPQREYIGIGAGAYSFINNHIFTNINPLDQYLERLENNELPISYGQPCSTEDLMSRYMVLGIYFLKIDKIKFKEIFGVSLESKYGETIDNLESNGLIKNTSKSITITTKGLKYIYSIGNAFYSEANFGKPQPIGVELQKGEGTTLEGIQM